jgi:LytS/YehU family sensor histidine kinase
MAMMREVNGHIPPPYHPKGAIPTIIPPQDVPIKFFLHHLIGNAFVVLIAILASLSMKWRAAERNIEKMQLASKEAELKYLKSQINPHFLLNTLNSVYALTDINPQRARLMIEELSKMLRYILYENQNSSIKLSKEVDIIRTYINLMEIRLAKSVKVDFDYIKKSTKEADIAPFIFMSLTENAFKHSNTRTQHAFISQRIIQTDTHIIMNCLNSCNPLKKIEDVGGLGLKQVTTQLEAYYPGRYKWVKGYNERTEHYVSRIEIKLT